MESFILNFFLNTNLIWYCRCQHLKFVKFSNTSLFYLPLTILSCVLVTRYEHRPTLIFLCIQIQTNAPFGRLMDLQFSCQFFFLSDWITYFYAFFTWNARNRRSTGNSSLSPRPLFNHKRSNCTVFWRTALPTSYTVQTMEVQYLREAFNEIWVN